MSSQARQGPSATRTMVRWTQPPAPCSMAAHLACRFALARPPPLPIRDRPAVPALSPTCTAGNYRISNCRALPEGNSKLGSAGGLRPPLMSSFGRLLSKDRYDRSGSRTSLSMFSAPEPLPDQGQRRKSKKRKRECWRLRNRGGRDCDRAVHQCVYADIIPKGSDRLVEGNGDSVTVNGPDEPPAKTSKNT